MRWVFLWMVRLKNWFELPVRQNRQEASLPHPCATRHRCIHAQCSFERPQDGPEGTFGIHLKIGYRKYISPTGLCCQDNFPGKAEDIIMDTIHA